MSDETDFFAPPPFDAAAALVQLKRQLRELKLSERGDAFETKARSIVKLSATDNEIVAHLAKRPAVTTPEWTAHMLRNSADVRRFIDTVKLQLTRWSADE